MVDNKRIHMAVTQCNVSRIIFIYLVKHPQANDADNRYIPAIVIQDHTPSPPTV